MASKLNKEYTEASLTDLNNSLIETRMELQKSTFTHSVKGLDNPIQIRKMRKKIARIQTELRAREVKAMDATQLANRSKKRARRAK